MKRVHVAMAYPGAELIGPRQLAFRVGPGHRLLAPGSVSPSDSVAPSEQPLLAGIHTTLELRPGFHAHITDIVHLCDLRTACVLEEIGLKIMLKLEGCACVSVGGMALPLEAGCGEDAHPVGLLLTLGAPASFERHCRRGARERMVVLTLGVAWLRQCGFDAEAFGNHLTLRAWRPSLRAVAIAEQMIRPPVADEPLARLATEAAALALICEAIQPIQARPETAGTAASGAPQRPAAHLRATRLRLQIETGMLDELTLNEIARRAGCNGTTLQREFRAAVGVSIDQYRRECRLLRAAAALRHQDASVARAAEIAGYGSQANFSTAFRRHFGVTPKRYRSSA